MQSPSCKLPPWTITNTLRSIQNFIIISIHTHWRLKNLRITWATQISVVINIICFKSLLYSNLPLQIHLHIYIYICVLVILNSNLDFGLNQTIPDNQSISIFKTNRLFWWIRLDSDLVLDNMLRSRSSYHICNISNLHVGIEK